MSHHMGHDNNILGEVSRRSFLAGGAAVVGLTHLPSIGSKSALPTPTHPQLLWQQDELAMFIHFGVNTFTDREWGDGTESPKIFNPTALDTRQWARTARDAGFRAMVLTAKHHDGFCLWPTATTDHSVAASPWRGGNGDLVREFTNSCREQGLRVGIYLSPWDQNHPSYGDSPRYNDVYIAQLTELLTNYGAIHEVWFDGANGEGPNGKRQVYDWPRIWDTVRRLQPQAVMFSDAGPDIRWIGNERGVAGETNWSTVDPEIVPVPGMTGDEVMRSLSEGDRNGSVWRPGETDTSIRPGWFYHATQDKQVRTVEDLVELYFTSVGRNSKLLLNVPPDGRGLVHEADVARLAGMHEAITQLFSVTRRLSGNQSWQATGSESGMVQLTLDTPRNVGIVDLREEITVGQRVARHSVEGLIGNRWEQLASGTTIGYRRLYRLSGPRVSAIRVHLDETIDQPLPVVIRAWE
jgi:alpha-L-fucosidase